MSTQQAMASTPEGAEGEEDDTREDEDDDGERVKSKPSPLLQRLSTSFFISLSSVAVE